MKRLEASALYLLSSPLCERTGILVFDCSLIGFWKIIGFTEQRYMNISFSIIVCIYDLGFLFQDNFQE